MKKNNFIYARYDKEDNCLGVYDTMEEAIWERFTTLIKLIKNAIIKPIIIFAVLIKNIKIILEMLFVMKVFDLK